MSWLKVDEISPPVGEKVVVQYLGEHAIGMLESIEEHEEYKEHTWLIWTPNCTCVSPFKRFNPKYWIPLPPCNPE